MLDWYFDCDGKQHSLRELLKPSPPESMPEATQKKSWAFVAGIPSSKLERIRGASTCCDTFSALLEKFGGNIESLAKRYCKEDPQDVEACKEDIIWKRYPRYGLDAGRSHNVFLALGRLEDGFRKPVAVKLNDGEEDEWRVKRIMRKLKPGSFIASAELLYLQDLQPTEDLEPTEDEPTEAPDGPLGRQSSPSYQWRWVSEAGVCTLEELFGRQLTPQDKVERNTKAHRMLVREILLSMALAMFHLHECKIAHTVISLKYFKVFLIEEPPRSTNLRVKLVSMRKAETLTDSRERDDIEDLGFAMARVVLGEEYLDITQLLEYDPSLYWLITWILEGSQHGATLADIIRHPYFTSLNEKEVFTLALEGDLFGQIITPAEVRCPPAPFHFPPACICSTLHSMFLIVFSS
jgi:hypothetical protein